MTASSRRVLQMRLVIEADERTQTYPAILGSVRRVTETRVEATPLAATPRVRGAGYRCLMG